MFLLHHKLLDALAAALAILVVGLALEWFPNEDYVLPLMASMGASAFLLFVFPHSPLSQPWPVLGGHVIAALAAFGFSHLIEQPVFVAAASIGLSVLGMHLLRCLHPPAAATALAIALSDIHLDDHAPEVIGLSVVGGALTLLLLAWSINNLLPGRSYPCRQRDQGDEQN